MPGKVATASLQALRNPPSSMQECELQCEWNVVVAQRALGRHMYNMNIYLIALPAVGSVLAPCAFPWVLPDTHPCKAQVSSVFF